MPHVVCVGDLMVDVVAQLPGPLAPGSDTPATITLHGGGAAANVAAWLAACGTRATFVGRVGDDALGRRAVADLTAAGVIAAVSVDPTRATGTCIVLVDPDGERTMIPDGGANAGLGQVAAAAVLPDDANCLYVSGYALLGAGSRPFALAALAVARERSWTVAVDAASAAPLAAAGSEAFAGWVGQDVLLFANDDEARVLAGLDADPVTALGGRFGEAVVKNGSAGAHWSDGVLRQSVAPDPVAALDSTGAGDAFSAGFLAARLAGQDVAGCLLAAAALGARAVSRAGARPAYS
jgi:sugar/nucleoside kinase (ribokinase family)